MKPKTVVLLVIAVSCGLAASYMTNRLLAERGKQEPVVEEKVNILVARKNLPLGTLLKNPEELFEEKPFIKGQEPKKAIKSFEQLKDKRLNKALAAEQFVSLEDLMDKSMDGLGAVMPKGMRAYGIKVTADGTSGGFVLPNSRVDVVWVQRKGDNDSSAKIILQNVLVLAVDTLNVRPEDKQAHIASTVTLAVTPTQAERLCLAEQLGMLKLTLRPFGDEEEVKTAGVKPKSILSGQDVPGDGLEDEDPIKVASATTPPLTVKVPEPPPAPKVEEKKPEPPAPKIHWLTLINGAEVKRVPIRLDTDNPADSEIRKSDPAEHPLETPTAQK